MSRIVSFEECVSAELLPNPHHLRSCTKSVSRQCENKGGNEDMREVDGYPSQNKVTYIIELFHVQ